MVQFLRLQANDFTQFRFRLGRMILIELQLGEHDTQVDALGRPLDAGANHFDCAIAAGALAIERSKQRDSVFIVRCPLHGQFGVLECSFGIAHLRPRSAAHRQ